MFPLRCTVASEIFSKSSMGNPIINPNYFSADTSAARLSSRPEAPLSRKHTSATENFSIGEEEEGGRLPTRRPANCFPAPMMCSLRYIVAFEFFF